VIEKINQRHKLSDLTKYTVLEVASASSEKCSFGDMAVLKCKMTTPDKSRKEISLITPHRYANIENGGVNKYPAVLVYMGMIEMSNSEKPGEVQTCHDLRNANWIPNLGHMQAYAESLRKLSKEDLEKKLRISRLSSFPLNTVFISHGVREILLIKENASTESVAVMSYETTNEAGDEESGEVFIPGRAVKKLEENPDAVLLYRGQKKTIDGLIYNDVTVVDSDSLNQNK